jgi:hypothetical protein
MLRYSKAVSKAARVVAIGVGRNPNQSAIAVSFQSLAGGTGGVPLWTPIHKPGERVPASEGVLQRLRQIVLARQASALGLHPDPQIGEERHGALGADGMATLGWQAVDVALDVVERADAAQPLERDRRLRLLIDVVELASGMGPARGMDDPLSPLSRRRLRPGQRFVPGIAVGVDGAGKVAEVPGRSFSLAITAVPVERHEWPIARPGSFVDDVGPDAPGLCAPVPGCQHADRGVIGKDHRCGHDVAADGLGDRSQPPGGAPDPVAQRRPVDVDAAAAMIPAKR